MYRNGASVDLAGVSKGITVAKNGAYFTSASQTAMPAPGSARATNSAAPGNSSSSADLRETNRLLAGLHDKFDDFSKKPWDFNNRAYQQYLDKIKVITDKATT